MGFRIDFSDGQKVEFGVMSVPRRKRKALYKMRGCQDGHVCHRIPRRARLTAMNEHTAMVCYVAISAAVFCYVAYLRSR